MRIKGAIDALGLCGAMVIGLLFAPPALSQELGEEWTALTAETADIIFEDPSLEDNVVRRMRTSDDGYQYTFEIALWTGPQSRIPKAHVNFFKLLPGYNFRSEPDPKVIPESFRYFKGADIDFAALRTTVSRLGRIQSRRFQFTGVNCVSFVQQFGASPSDRDNAGTKRIYGFYCADPGAPLQNVTVDSVLQNIEIRE